MVNCRLSSARFRREDYPQIRGITLWTFPDGHGRDGEPGGPALYTGEHAEERGVAPVLERGGGRP
jgi:hypothetical protein